MVRQIRRVVFADQRAEQDFWELARSRDAEDGKTHRLLQKIRRRLLKQYVLGQRVLRKQVLRLYQRAFKVSNLWSVELPPHGTVLYTVVGDEIRIVDIV